MDRPPSWNDVAQCYRLFLERDVEDASVALMQLAGAPALWDLIHRFAISTEAMRRRIHRASGHISDMYDPSVVETEVSDAQREELLERTLARWERCGRGFAYDHLFRDPRLFDDRSARWNREKRFEFGHEELERLFVTARRNRVALKPDASVLALGCDIAFLGAAVADRLGPFVGVEAGGAAFVQGCAALRERGTQHAELLPLRSFLDTAIERERTCDIFYSVMLLQHAPPPVSFMLLDTGLGHLNPGGYAYFQVPCHIYDYRFAADAYLSGFSEMDNSGEIHALPQAHILRLLAHHGLVPIEVLPEPRLGPMGFSFTFFARKRGRAAPDAGA